MMQAYMLVRLIEDNSEKLASRLLHNIHQTGAVPGYLERVPAEELKNYVYDIYRHLGEWLLAKTETDIEQRYTEVGLRRAVQGVPLSELVWVIALTKENLVDFLKKQDIPNETVDTRDELAMLQWLDHFFDRAIYYAAIGYERAQAGLQMAKMSGAFTA